jgi:acyl-CoA synthetase (AMP-forming)/AMP-acid ligase II
VPHPRWGEAVCAAVVPMPGTEPDEAALVAHVRAHLAAYKRPQRVVFVDALPRGGDGAVRRRQLRGDLARRRLFARAAPHLGKSTGSGGAVSARARARA